MRCVLVIVVSNLLSVWCRSVNYCGVKMCGHTNVHTLCQFSAGPGANCQGYIEARLSGEEKARVLARLNRRRSEAAAGRLRHLPTAGNMLKLRWVEELAREAQLWADQCEPPQMPEEHDFCRDLYSITVGQCVSSMVGEAPGLRPESLADMWYMESIHYKGNVTSYIPPVEDRGYYGDFGQMIWSQVYMVGCGRSRFMINWHGRLRSVERLVCNFAPRGPKPGEPLWLPTAPASACPPRTSPDEDLPTLCNYQYDSDDSNNADNVMSLEENIRLNAMLDIERNNTFNYQGSLDEMYLTKLAIATMDKQTTLSYYNYIERRDVIEPIEQDRNESALKSISENNITNLETTTNGHNGFKPKTFYKYKVRTVGRPKSYHLEELNQIGGDQENKHNVADNNEVSTERLLNDENDLYIEYEFHDLQENLTVIDSSNTTTETVLNESASTVDGTNENDTAVKDETNNTTATSNVNVFNRTESDVAFHMNLTREMSNASNVDKSVEDLSDSETIRELQNALDHMERASANSLPTGGKVRRELRGLTTVSIEDLKAKFDKSNNPDENLTRDMEIERNNSLERGPMLNMVLRYMPYLKQYERNILGHAISNASIITSSCNIFFVLLFCMYIC